MSFLPISPKELSGKKPDFICITGDAYVDHPSFGIAIIGRLLESLGFVVTIISQPIKDTDFTLFGNPKYGFMITGGNIDSMVSNYTVSLRKRNDDAYSPGGKGGKRPDRAVDTYCKTVRRLFPKAFIVIGGIEASLRRFAHYDYWSNKVLPSILLSSTADLLVYGMGEKALREICFRLKNNKDLKGIRGTCYLCTKDELPKEYVLCPSFKEVKESKRGYAIATRKQYDNQDEINGKILIQKHGDIYLVAEKPSKSLTQEEFDEVYELPYQKAYHPSYEELGGVPGITEVEFSVTHNRGCFGFCNFCSLALHQGRKVQTRSKNSILNEIKELTKKQGFKGYIHDIGGPTANFREVSCKKQLEKGLCAGKKCLVSDNGKSCSQLEVTHNEYLNILRQARKIPGVKKVFIRSGIRYDYLLLDKDDTFLKELAEHHTSGQLKVAPEHISTEVLKLMGKPSAEIFLEFKKRFLKCSEKCNKKQYLVPYFMSSHPGSNLESALELAIFMKRNNIRPEQVQDFYPTPGTISTAMFYTGLHPYTLKEVYVPKTKEEKQLQRALLQYFKPENKSAVRKALIKTGHCELIKFFGV